MSNQSNLIKLQLEVKHIPTIIEMLLNKAIPFSINTMSTLPLSINTTSTLPRRQDKAEEQNNLIATNHSETIAKKDINFINQVYEKYIIKDLELPIPKIEDIAKEGGMSVATFRSSFKRVFGKTFSQCYLDKRMEYAARLLKEGYRCNLVSEKVGYSKNSAIKFNKMFQKHFGVTPKKYQLLEIPSNMSSTD